MAVVAVVAVGLLTKAVGLLAKVVVAVVAVVLKSLGLTPPSRVVAAVEVSQYGGKEFMTDIKGRRVH